MDCRQTREFMSALVDNQIDDKTKKEAEEHIWRCASCRVEFELEKKTKEIVQTKVKKIPVPNDLVQNILSQIRTLHNGVSSKPIYETKPAPTTKPWLEIAFSVGVLVVTLSLAVFFATIYQKRVAERENLIREITPLVSHFDSVLSGYEKPDIIAHDPTQIHQFIYSQAGFVPLFLDIPDFQIVGASVNKPHPNGCVNLLYKKGEKMIFIHQTKISNERIPDEIKSRILKGEWIYDSVNDDSFVIWGTSELICCAVSNLPQEELERALKQSK